MLQWILIFILGAHSMWDCVAILAFLWFPSLRTVREMYPSIFLHQHAREDALVQRLLLYWMSSGSLCRLVACLYATQTGVWVAAALVYWLEALGLEYEALTACTMVRSKVRHMSLFSLVMGNLCAILGVSLAFHREEVPDHYVHNSSAMMILW